MPTPPPLLLPQLPPNTPIDGPNHPPPPAGTCGSSWPGAEATTAPPALTSSAVTRGCGLAALISITGEPMREAVLSSAKPTVSDGVGGGALLLVQAPSRPSPGSAAATRRIKGLLMASLPSNDARPRDFRAPTGLQTLYTWGPAE